MSTAAIKTVVKLAKNSPKTDFPPVHDYASIVLTKVEISALVFYALFARICAC